MEALSLSDVELHEILERAREIAKQGSELAVPDASCEAYLKAAEEVGIPREAILQALRERQSALGLSIAVGQTVFALSLDGFWYPAQIVSIGEHTAAVQFVHGDSHTCALADLRPLALIPGRKLQVKDSDSIWQNGTVDTYDPKSSVLYVTPSWSGEADKFSIGDIRLSAKIASPPSKAHRRLVAISRTALVRFGLLTGSIGLAAGVLLDRLLPLLSAFLR